jgi:hypothetical protein
VGAGRGPPPPSKIFGFQIIVIAVCFFLTWYLVKINGISADVLQAYITLSLKEVKEFIFKSSRSIQGSVTAPVESFVFPHTDAPDYKAGDVKSRQALDYGNIGLVS